MLPLPAVIWSQNSGDGDADRASEKAAFGDHAWVPWTPDTQDDGGAELGTVALRNQGGDPRGWQTWTGTEIQSHFLEHLAHFLEGSGPHGCLQLQRFMGISYICCAGCILPGSSPWPLPFSFSSFKFSLIHLFQKHEIKKFGNKQFISFKLYPVLCSLMESCAVLTWPTWNTDPLSIH